jgi:DNA-binding response OmpR family regulator
MERRVGAAADVLVVDDDECIRTLVSEVLSQAGFSVRAAATGDEALALARAARPDVAVLDINLPGISGYEVCHALRAEFGASPAILFLSGSRTEPLDRVVGLLLGADDYLVKPFALDELIARVRGLLRRAAPPHRANGLTPREREVLSLLAEGRTQQEISSALVIAPRTVATHIERILAKLGVHSRAEAVAAAYRLDLVRA